MRPKPPGTSLPIPPEPAKAKDPVCGMTVDPRRAAGRVEHNGQVYYFCSKRCADRFEQEPQRFHAAPGTAGPEPEHGQAHAKAHAPIHAERDATHAAAATARAAAVPSDAQGVRYTCPMHPEIVQ
ncbi:MAG TPA: YHS domain-containing protein, partial [Candidatus Sulfotelmatobacter sp.]|nr:YHS domain-containing protein [Candidatus Sulfotelmatobacter sp.]